jgi:hypothetical protein
MLTNPALGRYLPSFRMPSMYFRRFFYARPPHHAHAHYDPLHSCTTLLSDPFTQVCRTQDHCRDPMKDALMTNPRSLTPQRIPDLFLYLFCGRFHLHSSILNCRDDVLPPRIPGRTSVFILRLFAFLVTFSPTYCISFFTSHHSSGHGCSVVHGSLLYFIRESHRQNKCSLDETALQFFMTRLLDIIFLTFRLGLVSLYQEPLWAQRIKEKRRICQTCRN